MEWPASKRTLLLCMCLSPHVRCPPACPCVLPLVPPSLQQVLLLAVSRSAFEAALGPLSVLQNEHAAWRGWLDRQRELLLQGPLGTTRGADLLEVRDVSLWAGNVHY
jgi:hypothetical protein